MDISVIIVNYNTRDLLADCIESIIENTAGVDYEIIIVDNASHDNSREAITSRFKYIKWVQSHENLGFGRANNMGAKHACGKYLFFLNSDTVLKNNALKLLVTAADNAGESLGAMGCILENPKGGTCHSYGKFISLKTEFCSMLSIYLRFIKTKENTNPPYITVPTMVDYVTGADLLVPKTVFESTGGFDSDFFMYCEEVDWQKRMADTGLCRIVVPGPKIVHLEGGSDKSSDRIWSASRLQNIYRSKRIYALKHFSTYERLILRITSYMLKTPALLIISLIKRNPNYLKLIPLL